MFSLKKNKKRKNKLGFTLIEIMMALALLGTFLGSYLYLITDGLDKKKKAEELNVSVFLAKLKMDEIKKLRKPDEQSGKFEKFNKDYSYHYLIEEIEVDLMEMAGEMNDNSENNKTKEYLKEHGKNNETQTGAIFKMLHYKVTIKSYRNKYFIDFYRGLSFKMPSNL